MTYSHRRAEPHGFRRIAASAVERRRAVPGGRTRVAGPTR